MMSNDINIINDDGIVFLQSIADASIDMILTDPPYVISEGKGTEKSTGGVGRLNISRGFGDWDQGFTIDMLSDTIKEYYRTLRYGGYAVIFYDLWKIQELAQLLTGAGFKQLRFIEWIKTNPVPLNSSNNYLANSREVAVCAVKGGKPIFNSKYDNGVYSYPIYHNKDRFHPTQKPPELFKELIMKHTNPGDIVLDTFLGSGTTAIACMDTGRKFEGCEIDEEYYGQIVERIKRHDK